MTFGIWRPVVVLAGVLWLAGGCNDKPAAVEAGQVDGANGPPALAGPTFEKTSEAPVIVLESSDGQTGKVLLESSVVMSLEDINEVRFPNWDIKPLGEALDKRRAAVPPKGPVGEKIVVLSDVRVAFQVAKMVAATCIKHGYGQPIFARLDHALAEASFLHPEWGPTSREERAGLAAHVNIAIVPSGYLINIWRQGTAASAVVPHHIGLVGQYRHCLGDGSPGHCDGDVVVVDGYNRDQLQQALQMLVKKADQGERTVVRVACHDKVRAIHLVEAAETIRKTCFGPNRCLHRIQVLDTMLLRAEGFRSFNEPARRTSLSAINLAPAKSVGKLGEIMAADKGALSTKMAIAMSGDGGELVIGHGSGGMGFRGTGTGGRGSGGYGRIHGLGAIDTGGGTGRGNTGIGRKKRKRTAKLRLRGGRSSGACDKGDIAKNVRRRASALRACYEMQLLSEPELKGKVTLQWTIEPDGRVAGAKIVTDTIKNGKVVDCVLRTIKRIRFKKPDGGKCVLQWPFVFAPV